MDLKKDKIKINKSLFVSIVGIIVFMLFAIISLEGIGFNLNRDNALLLNGSDNYYFPFMGTVTKFKLEGLKGMSDLGYNQDLETIYCLSTTGLILISSIVVVPVISLFVNNKKINKRLMLLTILLTVIGAIFMFISFGIWASFTNSIEAYRVGYNVGKFIANIILVAIGFIISIICISKGYNKINKKDKTITN